MPVYISFVFNFMMEVGWKFFFTFCSFTNTIRLYQSWNGNISYVLPTAASISTAGLRKIGDVVIVLSSLFLML
ncbi:hypothetical protein AMQ68_06660 [Chryseobacterium sp. ERMR1:04]|nr:hypothetical protein AMQ68_06660 [Chryseobacterium sp. ERMR1:04]